MPTGKRQQAMGQAGGAVGRGHAQVDQAVQVLGAAPGQAPAQQFEAADDPGEHVVEVVGDTAGELADCFHFLRLAQCLFVMAQLGRAFFHLLFKGFKGGLQAQFAVAEVDQAVAGFVLPSTASQGGGHQADQGHWVERALKEGHVAQLRTDTRRRVLFRAAVMGQQDNGQVRPGWLLLDVQE